MRFSKLSKVPFAQLCAKMNFPLNFQVGRCWGLERYSVWRGEAEDGHGQGLDFDSNFSYFYYILHDLKYVLAIGQHKYIK